MGSLGGGCIVFTGFLLGFCGFDHYQSLERKANYQISQLSNRKYEGLESRVNENLSKNPELGRQYIEERTSEELKKELEEKKENYKTYTSICAGLIGLSFLASFFFAPRINELTDDEMMNYTVP